MPCTSKRNYDEDTVDAMAVAEQYGIETRTVAYTYTVSGLEEPKNVIDVIKGNAKLGAIVFEVEGSGLSKGDVLTVTVSNSSSVFEKALETLEGLGYIIPTLETQIIVPDLGEYLKTKDQLTAEVIDAIKNEVYKRRSTDGIDELYFTTFKPGVECKNVNK